MHMYVFHCVTCIYCAITPNAGNVRTYKRYYSLNKCINVNNSTYLATAHETIKHIRSYSIPANPATSLKYTVTVYAKPSAKPEVVTAAENTIHTEFIHTQWASLS